MKKYEKDEKRFFSPHYMCVPVHIPNNKSEMGYVYRYAHVIWLEKNSFFVFFIFFRKFLPSLNTVSNSSVEGRRGGDVHASRDRVLPTNVPLIDSQEKQRGIAFLCP